MNTNKLERILIVESPHPVFICFVMKLLHNGEQLNMCFGDFLSKLHAQNLGLFYEELKFIVDVFLYLIKFIYNNQI